MGLARRPARTPIFSIDLPIVDDPLPRFLDDAQAARLLRAASSDPDPLRRLVVLLLGPHRDPRRGALRAGRDAVVEMDGGHWLRVPLGKLHNDRYVPLHPQLIELLTDWQGSHDDHGTGLLLTRGSRPLNRHTVTRILNRVAAAAGLGHVHPHQLRHTLATQAINRGMRLEAIAAMLGHRTLRMTLIYARIANRTVADQYHSVSASVDALYADPDLPGTATTAMRRLQQEHRRMLGNGWCTRPPRPRLRLRDDLRRLRILPNHHRVPTRPASPTRPRRPSRPTRPRTTIQRAYRQHRTSQRMTHQSPSYPDTS